jgi:replication factor C small subunit
MTQLWLKYRPDTMADMVGLDGLKKDAQSWAVAGSLRCGGVIFNGKAGTGKTSATRAIAKDLLGSAFDANFHVFNASDDRGIGFVRDRLKPLAEQKAVGASFKVINLDEADGLTTDAQESMRQIIEITSKHTLWILTCNRVSRIIPALRSRLPTYNFGGLEGEEAESFLDNIIKNEGFPQNWMFSVDRLIAKTEGDLRACLKTMQICDPKDPDALAKAVQRDLSAVESLYESIIHHEWEDAMTHIDSIDQQGLLRDDVIDALHDLCMDKYKSGDIGIQIALLHLLILGQWAAKSSDWVSGDILFLRSMVGDYNKRC